MECWRKYNNRNAYSVYQIIILQQQLRLLIVIHDVDTNLITGAPVQETIQESFPIAEISRPSAPNATFTNTQTFIGANSLTITFQYRIICNTSTCGSDCSQTSNCQPFPSCVPITCADSPCLNGGTCSNVSQLIIIIITTITIIILLLILRSIILIIKHKNITIMSFWAYFNMPVS